VTTIERRKTCRDSTKKKKEATRMSEREPITDRLAGPSASRLLTFSGARVARLVGFQQCWVQFSECSPGRGYGTQQVRSSVHQGLKKRTREGRAAKQANYGTNQ